MKADGIVSSIRAEELEFSVLGTVEVRSGDTRHPIGGQKQRAVLAVLIVALGRRLTTDAIIDAVYGYDAPSGARRSVQTYVSNLRRELGDVIRPQPDGYLLDVPPDRVDAAVFEDAVNALLATAHDQPEDAADGLREALSVWRGHPFADIDGGSVISTERTRLLDLRMVAVEARLEADLALGRHRHLVPELRALTAEHPYREKLRWLHMLALYRSGQQTEALRAYETTRRTLAEDLGIEPSVELQTLNLQILDHDDRIALAAATPVARRAILAVDVDAGALGDGVPELHPERLAACDTAIVDTIALHEGEVFGRRLNATFARFDTLDRSLAAAEDILRNTAAAGPAPGVVRIGIDVGDVETGDDGVSTGPVVTRVTGLVALAHAGQAILSADARQEAADAAGWTIRGLGDHAVPHIDRSEAVHQLVVPGLADEFPELRTDALPIPLPGGVRFMPGYELRTEVGRSPEWVTWRAYQPSVGREVAIRVVRPELSDRPEFVRRFEFEALTVARLEHPHIVALYDYWRDTTGAYLVSRWIDGETLADRIARQPLSEGDASRLLEEIGSALDAAHAAGVSHGRVDAEAIMIDGAGRFYLIDFGVAGRGRETPDGAADITALSTVIATALGRTAALPTGAHGEDAPASPRSLDDLRSAWAALVGASAPFTETRNPYRGLSSFTFADAGDFHGRSDTVDQLVGSLARRRMVAVVGPSGVGKSSVVQAGLLPKLFAGAIPGSAAWFTVTMAPGAHPFEAMTSALLSVSTSERPLLVDRIAEDERWLMRTLGRLFPGGEVLVVIDQFEELYTATPVDQRTAFLDSLRVAASDPAGNARFVITLRADFFDRPLQHPAFGELIRDAVVPLAAPTDTEMRQMIEAPAEAVGVGLEAGLVDLICHDLRDEPGRLPLLEYSLTELFDQRTADTITIEGYEAMGGVRGALGRRTEEIYQTFAETEGTVVRQVFLRLVTLVDGGRATRRRVRRSELLRLDIGGADVDRIIDSYAAHRLLMLDRDPVSHSPTVEVAHEAIFDEWERLAGWIGQHHQEFADRRRLLEATEEWEATDRDDSALLDDLRLARFGSWAASTDLAVSTSEREFLERSTAAASERRAHGRRRRRRVLGAFAGAAAVAVLLAAVAWTQRTVAVNQADLAHARELILEAEKGLVTDPELSMMLALAAIDSYQQSGEVPSAAVDVLRHGIGADRIVSRLPGGRVASVSPDGSTIATMGEGDSIALWDRATLELVDTLGFDDAIVAFAWWAEELDELYVAVERADGVVDLSAWDPATGTWEALPSRPFREGDAVGLALSASGEHVVATVNTELTVWDRRSHELLNLIPVPNGTGADVSRDGRLAHVDATEPRRSRILDVATGEPLQETVSVPFDIELLSFSPAGTHLLAGRSTGELALIDLNTGEVVWVNEDLDRAAMPEWAEDGATVFVGGEGPLSVIDVTSGELIRQIAWHHSGSFDYDVVPGEELLVSGGNADRQTLIIDVSAAGASAVNSLWSPVEPSVIWLGQGGEHLIAAERGPGHAVLDLASGAATVRPGPDPSAIDATLPYAVVADSGAFVGGWDETGVPRVWAEPDGEVVYTAPDGWNVVGISDDGSLVVIQREFEGTKLVDVSDDSVVADLEAGTLVHHAAFSPDNRYVVTNNNGLPSPSLRVWATDDGAHLSSFGADDEETLPGWWQRFTPDGRRMVVGGYDGVVRVFDFEQILAGITGPESVVMSISAHENFIINTVVSFDGSMVASSSWNEPARLWDLETGALLGEFGTDEPTSIGFHPTEPWFYVGEGDTIEVHTLDHDELVRVARDSLSRHMTEEECVRYLRGSCDGAQPGMGRTGSAFDAPAS